MLYFILSIQVFAICIISDQDKTKALINDFIASSYNHWESVNGRMSYLEYIIESGNRKVLLDKIIQVERNSKCVKFTEVSGSSKSSERVYCINEKYAFIINKNDTKWVVEAIIEPKDMQLRKSFMILEFLVYNTKYIEWYDIKSLLDSTITLKQASDGLLVESVAPYGNANSILPKYDLLQMKIKNNSLSGYRMNISAGTNNSVIDALYQYNDSDTIARIPIKITRTQKNTSSGKTTESFAELDFHYDSQLKSVDDVFYLTY